MSTLHTPALHVPTELSPEHNPDLQLPLLPPDIKGTILGLGWAGVGIMVALVTENSDIMMLVGRETEKFRAGTLGPLGETSKQIDSFHGIPPLTEQPLSTLYRGISEELGVTEPELLSLRMKKNNAWRINNWPRGDAYPEQLNCAISFAVHLSKDAEALLRDINPRNDEIGGVRVLSADEILSGDPADYRQGVQSWLSQLQTEGLITPPTSELDVVDFGPILFGSKDIQID